MTKELSPGEITLNSLNAPIVKALDDQGITLSSLASKLKEELEATKTEFFPYQGKVIEKQDVTNWEVRQRARQDAHKLRGDYPAERKEHYYPAGIPVQVSEIDPQEIEAIKEAARVYGRAIKSLSPAITVDNSSDNGIDSKG